MWIACARPAAPMPARVPRLPHCETSANRSDESPRHRPSWECHSLILLIQLSRERRDAETQRSLLIRCHSGPFDWSACGAGRPCAGSRARKQTARDRSRLVFALSIPRTTPPAPVERHISPRLRVSAFTWQLSQWNRCAPLESSTLPETSIMNTPATVAVIGGMGPLASAEFVNTVYEQATTDREQEMPRLVLWSDPSFPDRTTALLDGRSDVLAGHLEHAIPQCDAMGAGQGVICCVTVHAGLPLPPSPPQ